MSTGEFKLTACMVRSAQQYLMPAALCPDHEPNCLDRLAGQLVPIDCCKRHVVYEMPPTAVAFGLQRVVGSFIALSDGQHVVVERINDPVPTLVIQFAWSGSAGQSLVQGGALHAFSVVNRRSLFSDRADGQRSKARSLVLANTCCHRKAYVPMEPVQPAG